jgi:hypothetical protein
MAIEEDIPTKRAKLGNNQLLPYLREINSKLQQTFALVNTISQNTQQSFKQPEGIVGGKGEGNGRRESV